MKQALERIQAEALRAQRQLINGQATNGRGSLRKIEELADDALRHASGEEARLRDELAQLELLLDAARGEDPDVAALKRVRSGS